MFGNTVSLSAALEAAKKRQYTPLYELEENLESLLAQARRAVVAEYEDGWRRDLIVDGDARRKIPHQQLEDQARGKLFELVAPGEASALSSLLFGKK